MHYIALKVLKVGQTHHQPGETVPGAEQLSNLSEMVAGGYLLVVNPAPMKATVEARSPAPAIALIPLTEALTPPVPTRVEAAARPTPSNPNRPLPVVAPPVPSSMNRPVPSPVHGKKSKK